MTSPDDNGAVNIAGLDKGKVVASLFNASKPAAAYRDPRTLAAGLDPSTAEAPMTAEEGQLVFDHYEGKLPAYFRGRLLRVDVSGDSFNPWAYDRDLGRGAAAAAVAPLMREQARSQSADSLGL